MKKKIVVFLLQHSCLPRPFTFMTMCIQKSVIKFQEVPSEEKFPFWQHYHIYVFLNNLKKKLYRVKLKTDEIINYLNPNRLFEKK